MSEQMAAGSCAAVDAAEFSELIKRYSEEDQKREELIKRSRDVLKLAKQAIFAMHRKDFETAQNKLQQCDKVIQNELMVVATTNQNLRLTGLLVGALEEYAEARIFLHFLQTRKLLSFKTMPALFVEEFLGGLMDCAGEVNRLAVLCATEGDEALLRDCAAFVGAVHENMLLMDLRNSPLRRKYDALKYTQKRLEALIYEVALAKRMHGIKLPSMMMEPEPEVETTTNQQQQ